MKEESLSPFYAELAGFLKERFTHSGFNSHQVESLFSGMASNSSETSLPLEEIIDTYQHLFKIGAPLEKFLLEAFSPKEFAALGLSRFYPRMYRGLPRVYSKDNPLESQIKKHFDHLPLLKTIASQKALYSLYAQKLPRGKLSLFTWVINDGLGDYTTALEAANILQSQFPDLDIQLILLIQEKTLARLSLPKNAIAIAYDKEGPPSLLSKEALQRLRNSDLILQLPTYYPYTKQLQELLFAMPSKKPMPKMELVGEYGYVESSWFHPQSGGHSMGLHFLEKGILIRPPHTAQWSEVENQEIRKWHSPENRFYLAYLASPTGGAIYLHALLKMLENDPQSIDLCVPDLGWLIRFIEKRNQEGKSILEGDFNILSIDISYQGQIHSLPLAEEGKRLRILCAEFISQHDFRSLLSLSGDWVAVRGNQSFSEAVAQGKPFFYDALQHARYFVKDLVALAQNRISSYKGALGCIRSMNEAFAHNLKPQTEEWVDETHFQEVEEWTQIADRLSVYLQDPTTASGFKQLCQIITQEFSANAFLCHLVQRGFCHRMHPEMAQFEEKELALFANGGSFTQMIQAQRVHLSRLA